MDASPKIIMTEKPKSMKFHAGEISFPGGKFDVNDSDLLETALRETSEEIGLDVSKDQVIGSINSCYDTEFWFFDFTICIFIE